MRLLLRRGLFWLSSDAGLVRHWIRLQTTHPRSAASLRSVAHWLMMPSARRRSAGRARDAISDAVPWQTNSDRGLAAHFEALRAINQIRCLDGSAPARPLRPDGTATTSASSTSRPADDAVEVSLGERAIGSGEIRFDTPLQQIVYITASPSSLKLSIESVRRNMPFIEKAVVLCPSRTSSEIAGLLSEHFKHFLVVTDEDLLGTQQLRLIDHQSRNTLLRKALYALRDIDTNFIASDDDYICLEEIDPTFFVSGGVHCGYYFLTDIAHWAGTYPRPSSYDSGLMNTFSLLHRAGYPTRAYSSHMPQVINKPLCNSIFDRLLSKTHYDEWSVYFNVAGSLYPQHFIPKKLATLGWPMQVADWIPELVPDRFAFENYYPPPPGQLVDRSPACVSGLERGRRRKAEMLAAIEQEVGSDAAPKRPLVALVDATELRLFGDFPLRGAPGSLRRLLVYVPMAARDLLGALTVVGSVLDARGKVVSRNFLQASAAPWLPVLMPEAVAEYSLHVSVEHPDFGCREAEVPLAVVPYS